MPVVGYSSAKGYIEFRCERCGKIVPFPTVNLFGACQDCQNYVDAPDTGTTDDNRREAD